MVALKNTDYKKYQKRIMHHIKLDLLILDDLLLHTITDEREIKVLVEVLVKRSELSKSTIVCSQREPKSWASMILNDEVSSNAIRVQLVVLRKQVCLWSQNSLNYIDPLMHLPYEPA